MRATQDHDLVSAARHGDSAAYGELFGRYEKRIYNFAYGILGNAEDARDCTQDAFIRVYEALPGKEHLEFQAYLYRTARNLAYDTAKARGRFTEPDGLDALEESGMYADPVRSTLFTEQQATVRDAVASLPEDYRAVLMLREVQELSYQEIADALDMPRNTVGVMIMRARLKFKGAYRMSHVDVEKLASECQAMLPKLSAYIDGELKEEERVRIEAHLEDCPLCRLALDEMRESSKAYRAFIPLIPPPTMFEHVMSRVGSLPAPRVPDVGTDAGGSGGVGPNVAATRVLSTGTTVAIGVGMLLIAGGIAAGWALAGSGPPATRTVMSAVATATPSATATVAVAPVTLTVDATADIVPIVDTKAPGVPAQLSPAHGARVPADVTLRWSAVKDPSGVTYEVDVDERIGRAGWEHVDGADGLTQTRYGVEATEMVRRWRVRAVDGAGNAGKFSAWREFFIDQRDPGAREVLPPDPPTFYPIDPSVPR